MKQYLDLLHFILRHGIPKQDRTKIGTLSIFGYQMRINLKNGFPLLTTKHCHFKSIVYELLWFLSGNTNISYLKKHKISIWNHWADKKGDLGPIYGKQWRYWKTYNNSTIDQILTAVNQLKNTPESRRILISAWNVGDLKFMSLPPCHILFQFYVVNQTLSCQVYQRSCDIFLGLPFNLASYALLTHMFAQQCELQVGELIWTGGDVHLYSNHIKQASIQVKRTPFESPKILLIQKPKSLLNYKFRNFNLINYRFHPKISAEIAI
ncbi:MAG: thymidylate synthase [Wigglesworthia glossinidia]|nr:thymidylate synthase [Wigglesworthia glossinidia]